MPAPLGTDRDGRRSWPIPARSSRLALLLALGTLAACATQQQAGIEGIDDAVPRQAEIADVPFFPQADYQCGPAALAMALGWGGKAVDPDELVEQVYSPERGGSLPTDLVGAARRQGQVAYPVKALDGLLREVAAGNPVIVLQDLGLPWFPRWHYAVVIGYDLADGSIVLHSGTEPRKVSSLEAFRESWEPGGDWGLVVLPPARLPATAEESAYLEALTGLERSRQWASAASGYRAALARWPDSLGALMGMGNSHYALGDLDAAEDAFRRAIRAEPLAAPGYNNLALVLAEKGHREEAIAAARQAVALGGPFVETYRVTLAEVSGVASPDDPRRAGASPP